MIDEIGSGLCAHLEMREKNGGERRMGKLRKFPIVVTNDSDVFRNASSQFSERFHRADGHKVIAAKDGGRRRREPHELQRLLITGRRLPITTQHKVWIEGNIERGQRLTISF